MKREPKYKVCRRVGDKIHPKCLTPKFSVSAARKTGGNKKGGRRKSRSEYSQQLLEKQKTRFSYGMTERQFSSYVKAAGRGVGSNPAEALFGLLERRLDNVCHRLGFASSRPFARQMVSHGHIMVNGRRMNIPSYHVKVGDKIGVRGGSKENKIFSSLSVRLKSHKPPAWLSFNDDLLAGDVLSSPTLVDANNEGLNLGSVIEFYSRS